MKTKQEYQEALNRMEETYYSLDNSMGAMNRFKEDVNSLEGLVNEHFEEKAETNLERYYDDLIKEDCSDFGIVNGKIESCAYIQCKKCEFEGGNCHKNRITWLTSKCKKRKYKLTKFEKELLQCYPDINIFKVFNPLNGMKEKGYFKGIDDNEIIGDILAKCEVIEDRKEVIKND